jgi:cell wall-associated NlpC family hydrolase
MFTRRDVIGTFVTAATGVSPVNGAALSAPTVPDYPVSKDLQSGDLLWPKKPSVIVPYDAGAVRSKAEDRAKWEKEKDVFIGNYKKINPYMSKRDIEYLRNMAFDDFYQCYVGTCQTRSRQPQPYSASLPFYVGHVAIAEVDGGGQYWVIEALMDPGFIVRSTYEKWIAGRPNELVWQGRLANLRRQDRSRITAEAKEYVGHRYDFWNFDLNDDSGFYCSKLIWLAAFRALGLAVDGNKNPKRAFWFSPKQLLYTPTH